MKTYHLRHDFGVYKETLKRNFYDNDRNLEDQEVVRLLERRTQHYTLEELRKMFGFLWTAHDDCVLANPDDYNPLQVHAARNKVEFGQSVISKLNKLADTA